MVASFRKDPVALREFRYIKPQAVKTAVNDRSVEQIALIVNDRHQIHHVHERGYVESPVRVRSILAELDKSGLFARLKPRSFPDKNIHAVHDADFVSYLKHASEDVPEGKSLYPYVFRFATRRARQGSRRFSPATTASTPSPLSTATPTRRLVAEWTAP